jgi:ubiquinone/menaquinone biosynthesis C-methylase UbiE
MPNELLITGKTKLANDKSASYEAVSLVYDELMKEVNYKHWGRYLLEVVNDHIDKKNLMVLELGAGNCKMAVFLSKKYKNYLASDLSLDMLKQAKKVKCKKVCCDMTSLPFRNKYDLILSTFDSVNYLLSKRKLLNLFTEVKRILEDDGIFTFDVSLEKNSLDFEGQYTIEGNAKGFQFTRKSFYNKEKRIHKNVFTITDKQGIVKREVHKQKIYKFETYFELIDKAGLYVVECLDAFTFNNGRPNSERVQFILKIDKNKC